MLSTGRDITWSLNQMTWAAFTVMFWLTEAGEGLSNGLSG